MEIIVKIIEIISNKISLPVAIFMAFLLFCPDSILKDIGIKDFINDNRKYIWLIFLFSTILYLYEKSKVFIKYSLVTINKKKNLRMAINNLNSLSNEEKSVVYYCLRDNRTTVYATCINSTMVSLTNKRIFHIPFGMYSKMKTPYEIDTKIWNYLNKNKDRFCSDENRENQEYNRQVNSFMGGLTSVWND